MEKQPVHSVEMRSDIAMYDLTVGSYLQFSNRGIKMPIVESEKAARGVMSYAIVQIGDMNGEPRFVAYTNNQRDFTLLERRMIDTLRDVEDRAKQEQKNDIIKTALAEKCLENENNPKHPKVIQSFDENSIRIRHNGMETYVNPNVLESIFQYDQTMMDLYGLTASDVASGLNIAMQATILDVEHGESKMGDWNFPCVCDFGYENNEIAMETAHSIYSTIDFSREFENKQLELINNRDEQAFFDPRFN